MSNEALNGETDAGTVTTIRPASTPADANQSYWNRLAARGKARRSMFLWTLTMFLVVTSVPILIPYFWLFTISVSARHGGVDSIVLWKSTAVLAPAVLAAAVISLSVPRRTVRYGLIAAVLGTAAVLLAVVVGKHLHTANYRFMWNPSVVEEIKGKAGAYNQYPSVWTAFTNSLYIATLNTAIVVSIATTAGYYLSRFKFPGRSSFLQGLLIIHAFPAMTLVIPIFLIMYWIGLLNTMVGVMLILSTIQLPFSIFIMKGFFDSVSWDIEMSALADGATRRQAFWKIMLPQVKIGMLAIGIFAFLTGWQDYIFVRTNLLSKSKWVMSLYLFYVSQDVMGVDYGIVAAVGVLYILPSLLIYLFCQKYLIQMRIGGIKG